MRIKWTKESREDLDRFIDFLIDKNPRTALKAIDAIEQGVERLCHNPKLGAPLNDGTERRELYIKFGRNDYTLRYISDYESGFIFILRAWHSREDR